MAIRPISLRYRAVVIGCGNIGALLEADSLRPKPATYAGAFKQHKNIELVGLADYSNTVLRRARALFPQARIYKNAEECIKQEQPFIVAIATPPDSHYQYLQLCKKYGVKAVICEKPVSDSLANVRKMKSLVANSNMVVVLNHQRRFFKLFQRARKKIHSGYLGKIRQVTAYYSNGILNNGSHTIDTLRFLLQDEIKWVVGTLNTSNRTYPPGDCNVDGLLCFSKGTVTTIQSFNQEVYAIHDLYLFGDKGRLAIGRYGYEFHWIPVSSSRLFTGLHELDLSAQTREYKKVGMVEGVVDHVVSCLQKQTKPFSTIEDGSKDLAVLFALIKSANAGGRRVHIEY